MPRGQPVNEAQETLDLICDDLEIYQAVKGYRFGIETLLLVGFVQSPVERVLDLGTGSGVMPLVMTRFGKAQSAVGVEIQPAMADRARRSAEHNGLSDQVEIIDADLRKLDGVLGPSSFDLVLSNPPYGRPGSGHMNPNQEKAIARHEMNGNLMDVVKAASTLVKVRSSFCAVVPPVRVLELLECCKKCGLRPVRLRMVHGRKSTQAKHCLLEAVRYGNMDLVIEGPLFVYKDTESYTDEVKEMLYPLRYPLAPSEA